LIENKDRKELVPVELTTKPPSCLQSQL